MLMPEDGKADPPEDSAERARERTGRFDDCGFRNADCRSRKGTMELVWIGCFAGTNLKCAFRNLKSAMLVGAVLFALCFSADAQQQKKLARVGFLSINSTSSTAANANAFRQGLSQLGYVEGRDIAFEWRYADGKADRLPGLAADLVGLKMDVIVTAATAPTQAVKQVTRTIPIVIATHNDPVGAGLVASLARPGGNVTGLSNIQIELSGKDWSCSRKWFPSFRA
jgi:putative ABC transport system substrate-binding protein